MGKCAELEETQCKASRFASTCEYIEEACQPIRTSKVLEMRRREKVEASAGWMRIAAVLTVGILVLFYAMQKAFGTGAFDLVSGKGGSESNAAYMIVVFTILLVLAALYQLLRKCEFSFACFFLGGESGLMEQPIDNIRAEKAKMDRSKGVFLKGPQNTRYDLNENLREPSESRRSVQEREHRDRGRTPEDNRWQNRDGGGHYNQFDFEHGGDMDRDMDD